MAEVFHNGAVLHLQVSLNTVLRRSCRMSMNPTLADTVTASQEVLFQEVGGEAVLLDLGSERYFGLDEVGCRIWQLLQEHGGVQIVFDRMLEEYDVEPARLEADLLNLLGDLAAAGLVSVDSGNVATS